MPRRVICLHHRRRCLIWSTEEENKLHQTLWKGCATGYTLEGDSATPLEMVGELIEKRSTEGLNTGRPGCIEQYEVRVREVSATSNPKTLRILAAYTVLPKHCRTLSTPVATPESDLLQRSLTGPSAKVFRTNKR